MLASSESRKYFFYALGEIALVVIGILIALQINNWNEWRKERILEKNVLIDLKDNLERNISLATNAISQIKEINRSSEIVVKFVSGDLATTDSLGHHFSQSSRSGTFLFEVNKDGYESFKNIGFEILSSKALKNKILNLFEVSYQKYESQIQVTNAFWNHDPFWWKDYFKDGFRTKTPHDVSKLQYNTDIYNIVNVFWEQRKAIIGILEFVNNESLEVLDLINEELSRS